MLAWSEHATGPRGRVHWALTSRAGGVSTGDHAGLNLGGHVGDDPAAVAENRRLLASAVGVPRENLVLAHQVHGPAVVVVEGPWRHEPPEADALVTARPSLVLAVLVADCVPVLLAAPREGIVAVAHAGRRGMAGGVVPATVEAMRDLGATEVRATLGPSICARCYEVSADVRAEVAATHPVTASVTWTGTPSLDVAAGVLDQLTRLGVQARQRPGCTAEDPDLYSYRRDGRTGRFAGLAWREPA